MAKTKLRSLIIAVGKWASFAMGAAWLLIYWLARVGWV